MRVVKTYCGFRNPKERTTLGRCRVVVNGKELPLAPSLKIFNHSPDGFNWGYYGSGPAQLALAILLDYTENPAIAIQHHQAFKERFVARWQAGADWVLTGEDIEAFLHDQRPPGPDIPEAPSAA